MDRIDTLREKEKLYKEVMERLAVLKRLEKESGIPNSECRELISLAVVILEKIRAERERREATPEELKEEVFREWEEKVIAGSGSQSQTSSGRK